MDLSLLLSLALIMDSRDKKWAVEGVAEGNRELRGLLLADFLCSQPTALVCIPVTLLGGADNGAQMISSAEVQRSFLGHVGLRSGGKRKGLNIDRWWMWANQQCVASLGAPELGYWLQRAKHLEVVCKDARGWSTYDPLWLKA